MRIALNIGGYQRDVGAIRVLTQQAAEDGLADAGRPEPRTRAVLRKLA